MYTPHSLEIALLMMITSAICWGSWANTYKGVKNYRFELFYWDYAVGIFLISLIFAFTLGSTANDANSFLNNVHSADTSNIVWVMIGGAIFNLANLLLVAAIDMAGFKEKRHHLRCFGSFYGIVGALRDQGDDERQHSRTVQYCGFLNARRTA